MKAAYKKQNLFFAIAIALVISGCGGSKFNDDDDTTISQQQQPAPTPTPTPSPTETGLPPINMTAELSGPGTPPPGYFNDPVWQTQDPIVTDSLFRVTIEAYSDVDLINTIGGGNPNNFNWNLSCAQYTVTVNGHSIQTVKLRPSNMPSYSAPWCANSPASQTIDFSGDVAGTGQQGVHITLNNAKNNWSCQYGYNCSGDMPQAYWNHLMRVRVCVQTNGRRSCN
ncbi:MAG: hypothetical protein AB7P04_13440 [Bacteriovoracia bacterium]